MDGEAWIGPLAAVLIGYALGSIPFGLLLTRVGGAGDLRAIGSGNIGATNVLRTGRRDLAAATLVLDAAKGALAVLLAGALLRPLASDGTAGVLAAAAAFLGHLYPAWLRFRGGKGVAIFLGLALALHWPCGLVFAAVWLAVMALSRFSSAGGMAAAMTVPVAAAVFGQFELVLLFLSMALLVLWRHRENIARLLDGIEPRIGQRMPATGAANDGPVP